jgi:hypothetical protein
MRQNLLTLLSAATELTKAKLTTHTATTSAPADVVWRLMSSPATWPSFDPRVSRVEGVTAAGVSGARLMAVSRVAGLRIPVDVDQARTGQAVIVTAHLLPGLREHADHHIVTTATGGTKIVSRVSSEGVFAIAGAIPVWLSAEVVVRLLAWRSGKEHRKAERKSQLSA